MARLSEAQRAFIHDNPFVAVLTTLRPDGSPHSTVVWVDIEGDDVVFNTAVGRAKELHLQADPRVGVTVVDPADVYKWVSINGRADLETEGAREMIDRLSRKYDGRDYSDEWMAPGEVRITARVHPELIDSSGFDS
jgi:PPOX class probable F420-dependent enzyme